MSYTNFSLLKRAARWLFILCLPVALLTASAAIAANSLWLYQYGFEKYDISQTTGLSNDELDGAAKGLIEYFNSEEENISLTHSTCSTNARSPI